MSYYDMSEELAEYILRLGTDSAHLKEMSILSRELSFVEEAPPLIVKKAIQEFCKKIDENAVKRNSVIEEIITNCYNVVFFNESILPVNMIPECVDEQEPFVCRLKIMLNCIKDNKPYSLPSSIAKEREKMLKENIPYD